MAAVANNPAFAKKAGVPASVGSDFIKADKGRTFGKGGKIMAKPMPMFGGKESYAEEMKEAKAIKSGKITPQQYAKAEGKEKVKPKQTRFAIGGEIPSAGRFNAGRYSPPPPAAGRFNAAGRYSPPPPAAGRFSSPPPAAGRFSSPPPPAQGMRAPLAANQMSSGGNPNMQAQFAAAQQASLNDAKSAYGGAQAANQSAQMNRPMQESQGQEQAMARAQQGADQNRSAEMAAQATQLQNQYAAFKQQPQSGPSLVNRVEPNPNMSRQFGSPPPQNQMNRPPVGGGSNTFQAAPAFKKGGFIKSADGIASKGKTKAQQFSSGGRVSSRADGIATKGKTRGKMC